MVVSPVLPIMTSSSSSLPPPVSNTVLLPQLLDAKKDTINDNNNRPSEFMTKARSYIGPQLTINIK